jgi:hypothetical protein
MAWCVDQMLSMQGLGTNIVNGNGDQSIPDTGGVITWGDLPLGWPTQPSSPAVTNPRSLLKKLRLTNQGSYGDLHVMIPSLITDSWWSVNGSSWNNTLDFTIAPGMSTILALNLTRTGTVGFHNDTTVQIWSNNYAWLNTRGYSQSNVTLSVNIVELVVSAITPDYTTSFGNIYNNKLSIFPPDGTAFVGYNVLAPSPNKIFAIDQFAEGGADVNITSCGLSGPAAAYFSLILNPRPISHNSIAYFAVHMNVVVASPVRQAIITITTNLPRGAPYNTYTFAVAGLAMSLEWISLASVAPQLSNTMYLRVGDITTWKTAKISTISGTGMNSTFSMSCYVSLGINSTSSNSYLTFNTSVNSTQTTQFAAGWNVVNPVNGSMTCGRISSTDFTYDAAFVPVFKIYVQGRISFDRSQLVLSANSDATFQLFISHAVPYDIQLAVWSPSSMISVEATWTIPANTLGINITVHSTGVAVNVVRFSATSNAWQYNFVTIDDLPFTIVAGCGALIDPLNAVVNNHSKAAIGDQRTLTCNSGYEIIGSGGQTSSIVNCTNDGWLNVTSFVCATNRPVLVSGGFTQTGLAFLFDRNMSSTAISCQNGLTTATYNSVQSSLGWDTTVPVCKWAPDARTWVVTWANTSTLIVGETVGLMAGVFYGALDSTNAFTGTSITPSAPSSLPTLSLTIGGPVSTRSSPSLTKCDPYVLTANLSGDPYRNAWLANFAWTVLETNVIHDVLIGQGYTEQNIQTFSEGIDDVIFEANAARDSTNQGTSVLGQPVISVTPSVIPANFTAKWQLSIKHWTGLIIKQNYTVYISKAIRPIITLSASMNMSLAYGSKYNNSAVVSLGSQCISQYSLVFFTRWSIIAVLNGTASSGLTDSLSMASSVGGKASLVVAGTDLAPGATYIFSVITYDMTTPTIGSNVTAVLRVGANTVDPTYVPVVVGARIADDGNTIMISWDVPTNKPFGPNSFTCDKVLTSAATDPKFGVGVMCTWYNSTTLAMTPSNDAYYDRATTTLTTQSNVVKSESEQSTPSIGATVSIALPMAPPVPTVSILGTTTVLRCQPMIFTPNVTSGFAGRNLKYNWTVTDFNASAVVLQTMNIATLTVNQLLLTAERSTQVSLIVTNWLGYSSVVAQVWVVSTLLVMPSVTLMGSSSRTTARVDALQIDANIGSGVCGTPAMTYIWTKLSGPTINTIGVTLTAATLIVPARHFTQTNATYLLNFRASLTGAPAQFVTFNVSVFVTASPLQAGFTGMPTGTELFLSRASGIPLILNAYNLSTDPDAVDALRHEGLGYRWTCNWLSNGATCFPSGGGADNLLTSSNGASSLIMSMALLSDTGSSDGYVFKVSVTKDTRITNATVIVHVASAAQLTVNTRVQASGVIVSDGIVNPSSPFELVSSIADGPGVYTYQWSCITSGGNTVNLTALSVQGKLRTGLTGPYLAFIAGVLQPAITYTFTVTATQVSNAVTGTSKVTVGTDLGATGGTCTTSPSSGDVTTYFAVSCTSWTADAGSMPLSYVWYATMDGNSFQVARGTSSAIQLAPGAPPLHQRTITAVITNARGTMVSIPVTVTVTALSSNTTASDVIASLADRLSPSNAVNDPGAFSQAYAISTSLLSSLPASQRASAVGALVDAVVGLANGTVATADSVAQRVALVSQVTTGSSADLGSDARAAIAKLLVETTQQALSLGAVTPTLATTALTALGDVLSAASSTSNSTSSSSSEASSLATAFATALSSTARGLVYGQLPGETITVSTPTVTLQAAQDTSDNIAGSSVTVNGQHFSLPSTVFSNSSSTTPSSVGYSMSVQNASLFAFAANGTVSGSSLVSLSLFDATSTSGGVLDISDLIDEIRIIINHAAITIAGDTDTAQTDDLIVVPPRARPKCRWFDFRHGRWSTEGCRRDAANSTSTRTECLCTHLTDFNIELGSLEVPHITEITLQDIYNLQDLLQHPTAMIWLAALWILYIFLLPISVRLDDKKHLQRETVPQTKNDPRHWRHPSMRQASRYQRWKAYVRDHFKYDHLWFSVYFRRPHDNFSSAERLTSVFVVIIGSMAVSAAFWSQDQGGKLGTIVVGIISSCALIPASAGLRFIFRRAGTDPTGGINHAGARKKDEFIRMKTARLGGLPAAAMATDGGTTGTVADKYAATMATVPPTNALAAEGSIAVEMSSPTAGATAMTPLAASTPNNATSGSMSGRGKGNKVAPTTPPMGQSARISPAPSSGDPLLAAAVARGSSSSPPPGNATSPLTAHASNASKRSLVGGELGAVKTGAFGVDQELPREDVKDVAKRHSAKPSAVITPTAAADAANAMVGSTSSDNLIVRERSPSPPVNSNGAEEKRSMLPNIRAADSSATIEMYGSGKKKRKSRCCCSIPKTLPLYWKKIGWVISIIWALGCSFIILVYGVKFDQYDKGEVGLTTAARWMLSSL